MKKSRKKIKDEPIRFGVLSIPESSHLYYEKVATENQLEDVLALKEIKEFT